MKFSIGRVSGGMTGPAGRFTCTRCANTSDWRDVTRDATGILARCGQCGEMAFQHSDGRK
ncbi:hypothetical protein [Micromonospora wenchangensis]|uniref:hypothetical protein n=1 Tax=Micromonospora wenchangensis TaxID=1185415 RepID=UPI003D758D04